MKLLLVTITSELARFWEYYDSIDRLITPPNTEKLSVHSSSPARNRNAAIKYALKNDFTHIFFTDDDHVYPNDTVTKLIARNVDIVSGMYVPKMVPFPIIAMSEGDKRGLSKFINMNQYGPNELVEIPRVPAGCLLVTCEALKKMQLRVMNRITYYNNNYKDIYFAMGQIEPDNWCEDLYFCDRAREAGLKIYIDTGVPVGHITKVILQPKWNGKEWEIEFKINEDYRIGFLE